MRYKSDDPKFKNYKVELDGEIQKEAVEADDKEGWVKIEKTKNIFFGQKVVEKKTLYGRVFIVRFEPPIEKEIDVG